MKERLIVKQLRNFIDNAKEYPIALIAGIRLVGKTTVLTQLQKYYPGSVYIDLANMIESKRAIQKLFTNPPDNLILLDEIAYIEGYESLSQFIYNQTCSSGRSNLKVVMTGSSPAHIVKLARSKLGARSKLFRLPPVTLIEYLYFTERISDYEHYHNVTNDDFINYLQLKHLKSPLALTFDENYFEAFFEEHRLANENSHLSYSLTDLGQRDLSSMAYLIAYKLNEMSSYQATIRPEVGEQEFNSFSLQNSGIAVDVDSINLSDVLIANYSQDAAELPPKDIARLLTFLLYSGLANIEFTKISHNESISDYGEILFLLRQVETKRDLMEIFRIGSICLTTPLLYTRLGEDILNEAGISKLKLYMGPLLGKMLEVYVRGGLSLHNGGTILTSIKMQYDAMGEVDICLPKRGFLCEVTISDKPLKTIHVTNYYKESSCIRVCSTKTKELFRNNFHRIPYAKFCCMIDTGEIFKLDRTIIQDSDISGESHIFN